jgi:hypothetical protein
LLGCPSEILAKADSIVPQTAHRFHALQLRSAPLEVLLQLHVLPDRIVRQSHQARSNAMQDSFVLSDQGHKGSVQDDIFAPQELLAKSDALRDTIARRMACPA